MELNEEEEDAEEEWTAIWHLKDLPDDKGQESLVNLRDDVVKEFLMDDEEALTSLDNEDEPEDDDKELKPVESKAVSAWA